MSNRSPAWERESAAAYVRGRAEHAQIALDDRSFGGHLARVLERDEKVDFALSGLAIEDLYLACACFERDANAVSIFLSRYRSTILDSIREIVPRADAEDVCEHFLQDLLLPNGTASPKIATYSGKSSLARWLGVAARRAALMWYRKTQLEHRARRAVASDPQQDGSIETSFLKGRYRGHFEQALKEALQRLPERDRVLLRLRFVNGVTVEKIATIYKVSQPTMSRRLAAAREALLDYLKETLRRELGTSSTELASLARMVASQLDVSLPGFLKQT